MTLFKSINGLLPLRKKLLQNCIFVAFCGTISSCSGSLFVDDSVIKINFQHSQLGTYSQASASKDFDVDLKWSDGLNQGRAMILAENDNHFLRISYPAGGVGPANGGAQFIIPFEHAYNELYLSYRVRFGPHFEFVKGGKLPGLIGGKHPTGCKPDADGFSARNMWRPDGLLVQYVYWPNQPGICGDDLPYKNATGKKLVDTDRWYHVVHRIKLNELNKNNGVLQAWVDGELLLDENSRIWRLGNATFGIDGFYFSTFFGGNDPSWAPTTDQFVDFDDFVVSERPIALK